MKHYLLITGIEKEELKRIRDDFKVVYGVDLDNKKYDEYDTIENKWDAIVQDLFLNRTGQNKEAYVKKLVELMESVLYIEPDRIIRSYDIEIKERQNNILKLEKYMYEMQMVIDDYEIYEPDIWMNLYLSIQYMRACMDRVNDEESVGVNDENKYEMESKGHKYIIPFSSYQEGFCESFTKKILGKDDVQILGADINSKEKEYVDKEEYDIKFTGYRKRAEKLELGCDKKYTRWSQKKIDSLMKYPKFKTEDVAMFHKIINGSFVCHLVDTMISTERCYDVEDYIYLLDKLCMCKSINWQNLIGCLFIKISSLKQEFIVLDLWAEICVMFESWMINLEVINRRLELLVGGLVYLIYRQDSTFSYIDWVEEKCIAALEEIEKNPIPFSDQIKDIIESQWKEQKDELRVYKKVEQNHQQYDWVYAIMQRCVIDSLTPHKCDELRNKERDWDDVINVLFSYNDIAKQTDKNENEVEQEIDQIVENGSGKFLDILWRRYIDIKARETHGTFQLNPISPEKLHTCQFMQ